MPKMCFILFLISLCLDCYGQYLITDRPDFLIEWDYYNPSGFIKQDGLLEGEDSNYRSILVAHKVTDDQFIEYIPVGDSSWFQIINDRKFKLISSGLIIETGKIWYGDTIIFSRDHPPYDIFYGVFRIHETVKHGKWIYYCDGDNKILLYNKGVLVE